MTSPDVRDLLEQLDALPAATYPIDESAEAAVKHSKQLSTVAAICCEAFRRHGLRAVRKSFVRTCMRAIPRHSNAQTIIWRTDMRSRITSMPNDQILQKRAVAVAAFKARVDTTGMTRPARAVEERAFLESIGAVGVFLECPRPGR